MQDVFDFFQGLGIDTKNHQSGAFYTKCPKCHDERRKRGTKELLVNLDTGYTECFHCGWTDHILKNQHRDSEYKAYIPPPPKPQKFISPEPAFNWVIPDAVLDPLPVAKPMRGKFWITWYYRNINDKLTAAKKMEYNFHENGFNREDSMPIHLFTRDSGYYPCLFYERDLATFRHATVILVESEKTAAILRKKYKEYLKEFIYLATGGSNGLTDDKAKVLAGRNVLICYDCDNGDKQEDGTIKGPKGREGAQSAHTKLAGIATSFVVDIDPSRNDGTDLADINTDINYIRGLRGEQKYPKELIDAISELNREGTYWKMEKAQELGERLLINPKSVYELGRVYFGANEHEFGITKAPLLKKIEYFLRQRYDFKRNSLTKRVTYRDSANPNAEYQPCNFNDIWRLLQHNIKEIGAKPKDIGISHVSNLLESDFVPEVNPFHEYFHSLPNWDGHDHIKHLANHVQTTDQPFWLDQFRKCLIRMIACTYGLVENRIVMVLVQEKQESGKSTWLRFLCPPQLNEYYKEDPIISNKDTELALASNFIWNLDELAQLNKKEVSELKGIISRSEVKQRRAYGRTEEKYHRIVNFWGSTNKSEFLTDIENTRWLCFNVVSINHDYNNFLTKVSNVDITKVWAQAWHLYKAGEQYVLNQEERYKRDIINHSYEYMSMEKELIIRYLTPCKKGTIGADFVTVTEILEYLIAQTGNKLKLVNENVGRAMSQLDFEKDQKKVSGENKNVRGYWALRQPLLQGTKSLPTPATAAPEIFQHVPGANGDNNSDLPF